MHTKEQTIELLKKAFDCEGQLTYQIVFKYGIYQHDIKKYFGTLDNACNELNIDNNIKQTKEVNCTRCNKILTISKYSLDDFGRYCDDCKIVLNNEKFDSLKKDHDYLECPACGFRTQTLESHYRKSNKTWTACKFTKQEVEEKFGKLRMFASVIDNKAKNKRRENGWYKDEEDTKRRMSASGGKHCKGKTKENCEYIRKMGELRKSMLAAGLIENRKYKISKEDLEKTALSDGINSVVSSKTLNIPKHIVGRLCNKFNLKRSRRWQDQTYILETISSITNCAFKEEFQFKNIKLRYDGIFEDLRLLVEVNGYQHYVYPNYYHRTLKDFEDAQKRDIIKEQLAKDKGFKFLAVSYKDDLSQESLKKRLVEVGVF